MANNNAITRVENNGVEYYTLKSGESGMSLSGLGRLCGVSKQAGSKHLGGNQKDWNLDCGKVSSSTKRVNSRVVIVKDTTCAEVIAYYAQQGRTEAIRSLIGFAAIGIRSFIHCLN